MSSVFSEPDASESGNITTTLLSSVYPQPTGASLTTTPTSTHSILHNGIPPAAALTTVFTPLAGCPTAVTDLPLQLSCMPSGYNEYIYKSVGYFSPAICPTGYTIGCSREASGGNIGPAVGPTETAMICCPSQYSCAPSSAGMCVNIKSTSIPLAYGLQIRWASTDLPNLQTDPMKAMITAMATASSSIRQSSTTTSTSSALASGVSSSNGNSDDSFPLYAKIGVGAGVGVLLLLIALCTCIIVRRRRKSRPVDTERRSGSDGSPADTERDHLEKPAVMASANEILNTPNRTISSKRSSRSRTNSYLATLPENKEVGKRGHISWQPEIQQREIMHPEPFSPEVRSPSQELERSSSAASRRVATVAEPLAPVSRQLSPGPEHSVIGRVSGRASPSMDYLATGKQPVNRVAPSPDRRSRTSPSPKMDRSYIGTSMTPDVDPDSMRTVEAAWHTFFDTSPAPESAPVIERHQRLSFVDPDPPYTPLTEEEEIAALKKQRSSIEDKRSRLMQLDRLDDELERVNAKLKSFEAKRRREMRIGG